MRILLDAYFDNNFGDDLFADILLKRYPDALFYAFWKNTPESVIRRAARFRNLVILPGGCAMQESWPFDAFVMIGGDVLPDGVDYSERIARMKHVKECGGFVAMLGFSLYKEYGEKTAQDLKIMAELADVIVIRDHYSAERFKALVPGTKVLESTDMVFAAQNVIKEAGKTEKNAGCSEKIKEKAAAQEKEQLLGIIPRRKLYSTEEEHLAYCKGQAAIADAYLQKYPAAKVRFLAYSTGEYDDRMTAKDIIAQMKVRKEKAIQGSEVRETGNTGADNKIGKEITADVKRAGKVEIVSYEGNIETFSAAIGECSALLPTRFHGLVFALMNRQPFVPVPYEVKLTQLLDELGYDGVRVPYGEEISEECVQQAVEGLECFGVSGERMNAYEQKAAGFFEAMDAWYADSMEAIGNTRLADSVHSAARSTVTGNADDAERNAVSGGAEAETETSGRKDGFRRYPEILCEAGEERKALQEENQMLTRQVEELNKWIQSLQQQQSEFETKYQELEALRKQKAEELLEAQSQCALLEVQCKAQKLETDQCSRELESQKRMAQAQEQELMNWVTSLQKERATFERQNLELESIRRWQWDQLMRVPLMSHKIESEYNSFLQSLREKLDKQFGL